MPKPNAIFPPVLLLLPLLGGCKMVALDPSGDVAVQQRNLILLATGLMLLIILPVIGMTLSFAWTYRASNANAVYAPEWHDSNRVELAVWGAPLIIVMILGVVTWAACHTLDPYRPLARIAPGRPVDQAAVPLEVDVVALDWKWLFIYPQYGVASVNEMAAPLDRPITFKITASSVMNSFNVPALAGQVYAMPGMQTQLHAVINRPGIFAGFSANYSGAGFSGMRFKFQGLDQSGFDRWIGDLRVSGNALTRQEYLSLARPSANQPVRRYAKIDQTLFVDVVDRCPDTGIGCGTNAHRAQTHQMAQLAAALRELCLPRRGHDAQTLAP
jgi:cytochrome o ubiquinol oxidase subunit 2